MEILYDGHNLASPPLESPPSPADSIHSPPPEKSFYHWPGPVVNNSGSSNSSHGSLSASPTQTSSFSLPLSPKSIPQHQSIAGVVMQQPLSSASLHDVSKTPDLRPMTGRRAVSAGDSRDKRRPATPDGEARAPFSPRRKHRRGLSVIAAPIDHSDMSSPRGHSGGHECSPLADSFGFPSPVVPMHARFPDHQDKAAVAGAVAAELYSNANLQDILVMLAHKERQVLEARHALDDAQQELAHFRTQVDAVLGPTPVPLRLPCRPRILPRPHMPYIGLHTLTYSPVRVRRRRRTTQLSPKHSTPSHHPSARSTPPPPRYTSADTSLGLYWSIDGETDISVDDVFDSSALTEYSSSDDSDVGSDDESPAPRRTLSRRFVLSLLGWVQCVIATLPTYQRAGFAKNAAVLPREVSVLWLPDYPSSTETFYGFLAYEK